MKYLKHSRGVTLVELSTTLAAAAIVMTLGVPAFRGLHSDMHSSQVRSDLMASFALARSEAIRRGVAVSVCPSADGATCAKRSATDWSTGWIVKPNEGEPAQVLAATRFDEPPFSLAAAPALSDGVTFSSAGLPSSTGTLSYSDATTRSVFRLLPIGRLELLP
jgi:type IV fimbrial biogenesis protein FimT